jgi:hypothetical protein
VWKNSIDEVFSKGRDPWTDIFPVSEVQKLGSILGVTHASQVKELRFLLVYMAHDVFKRFGFVGGTATSAKAAQWRRKVISKTLALRVLLVESSQFHKPYIESFSGKRIVINASTGLTKRIHNVCLELEKLLLLLEKREKSPHALVIEPGKMFVKKASDPELFEEETNARVSNHLLYVVENMSAIYLRYRASSEVTRISELSGNPGDEKPVIRGRFADFVRASSERIVRAYLPSYAMSKKRMHFNSQIQLVVQTVRRTMKS